MPHNPNLQKLGKRKNIPVKQQASWLFPSGENASLVTATTDRSTNKDEKNLAKKLLKQRAASKTAPLISLIGDFLSVNKFTSTAHAFQTESNERGVSAANTQDNPSLSTIYEEWLAFKADGDSRGDKVNVEENGKVTKKKKDPKQKKAKVQEVSSGDSSDDSSDGSSVDSGDDSSDVAMADAPLRKTHSKKSSSLSSSSSSDSDADDEKDAPITSKTLKSRTNGLKRKATSSSSGSSSSRSDSSSDNEGPRAKKAKTKPRSLSSSESSDPSSADSSSKSESGSEGENKVVATKKTVQIPSSLESETSSESGSVSESESNASAHSLAKKTPLPDSDSESSSDSESDNESSSNKKAVLPSESSATLSDSAKKSSASSDDSSSGTSSSDSDAGLKNIKVSNTVATTAVRKLSPPLPPDPVAKKSYKKSQVPFSRISKDQHVDERLASNAFVPYDYAQKAHEDLIVTKGKGFTKEKNKKKRGSYRGGMIDIHGKKGIRFDD